MVRSNSSSRTSSLAVVAYLLVALLAPLAASVAQAPSADQIAIFQGLPPDQQQAILDSLGRSGQGGTGTGPRADRRLNFPETVRTPTLRDTDADLESDMDREDSLDGRIPREPRLKAADTVLLSLE